MTLTTHQKNIASVIHLSALSKYIFPFGNFIMPLIFWTMNKDKSEFIDKHGKACLNFQLSIFLYLVVISCLSIPLFLFGIFNHFEFPDFWLGYDFDFNLSRHDSFKVIIFTILIGLLALAAIVLEIVFIIIATSKANQGELYKYPITINFLK
ncbi:MAG: DUF4870 domain-containing protein [Bacteroidia bacterium]|nr:DUF4870 domain-containing protein [Bacteroidia bacterium]